jgi:hypothetical protein
LLSYLKTIKKYAVASGEARIVWILKSRASYFWRDHHVCDVDSGSGFTPLSDE